MEFAAGISRLWCDTERASYFDFMVAGTFHVPSAMQKLLVFEAKAH